MRDKFQSSPLPKRPWVALVILLAALYFGYPLWMLVGD